MSAALTAEGLHTYYGKSHILHGVSLEVAEGKITALLGRNGAGKTTTLRSLMGLTPAREGKITMFGEDTTHWPTFRIAAQRRRLRAGRPAHLRQSQRRGEPQGSAGARRAVDHRADLPAVSAPRGAQAQPRPPALRRRAGDAVDRAARCCSIRRLLILDEPSQGLAPLIVREVFRIVQQMKAEGISVLLVEQNARMSLEIADNAYVLDDGIVVYSGSARELAADEARVRALAGASAEEWTIA